MTTCKRVNITKKKICIGDLKHKVIVQTRALIPAEGVDYAQEIVDLKSVWAAIQTTKGVEIFDGTNTIGVATHFFYVRTVANLTFENFVEYKDKKFRILDVQEIDEDDSFLLLRCTERGDKNKNSNLI